MKWVDGKAVAYVQESVLNTYKKFDGYPIKAADKYWEATSEYWENVRQGMGCCRGQRRGGITIEEEANTGTVISGRLLEMGTKIAKGEMAESAAIAEAQKLIRTGTSGSFCKNGTKGRTVQRVLID